METVREQADRLYKLHKQRGKLETMFSEADAAYVAGEPGNAAAMKTRTDAGDALNRAIAAGAELRRLAARHPGYFRDGWRESPEMIPVPLTVDERFQRMRNRADEAAKRDAETKAQRDADREQRIAERKQRDDEIRDERRRASEAAGQAVPPQHPKTTT